MSSIDFVIVYPCYIPVQPNGICYTFNAEGDDCVALFTDEDLLNQYFSDFITKGPHVRLTFQDQEVLADFLEEANGKKNSAGHPVTHIIIDQTAKAIRARVYSIQEFLKHLKQD